MSKCKEFDDYVYSILASNTSLSIKTMTNVLTYLYRDNALWAKFHKAWVRSLKNV